MKSILCTFSQFSKSDHAGLAGSKGEMLAKLYQSGYPVPDGFVILSTAFDENGLKAEAHNEVLTFVSRLIHSSPTQKLAVRSSALAEDSANASYAGEFETVLNVSSETGFYEAIQTVFESSKSESVKIYAEAIGQTNTQIMAVVVQHMLAPSCAGVLFTSDPIVMDASIMRGNLTEGLADKLVAGEVTGDAFCYRIDTGAYDGPDYFKPYQQALYSMATKLLHTLKAPQDIEWAIHQGKLFLLQCRPITHRTDTPEVWNDSLKYNCLWSNTNFGEMFGNVITPFTWSVLEEFFKNRLLGRHIAFGLIAGHIYNNISLIYSFHRKLGKKHDDALSSFNLVYGNLPDHLDIPIIPLSWLDLIRVFLLQIGLLLKASLGLRKYRSWAKDECPAWCEEKFLAIGQSKDNADLLRAYADTEPAMIKSFEMVSFVTSQFINHQNKLKAALSGRVEAEDIEVILSGLEEGSGQLQSMGLLMGIAAVRKGDITQEEFMRQYGHRGIDEAEFASPRIAEDPDWIDKLIAQQQVADPSALLSKQKESRNRIWKSLEQRQPKQAVKLRKLCATATTLAYTRELIKSENFRISWAIRKWVEKAEEINQQKAGELFYLSKDELIRYMQGDRQVLDHIPARRETYAIYSALPPLPNLISGPIDPFQWAKMPNRRTDYFDAKHPLPRVEVDNVIKGFPGSPGLVEGTVRVLLSHECMDEFVNGEILVTSFANVGWTPLFPHAAAIVTDIGAPLSHAAIVARELGIPAVFGTGSATMKLKTGDKIRVNGGQGIVELL